MFLTMVGTLWLIAITGYFVFGEDGVSLGAISNRRTQRKKAKEQAEKDAKRAVPLAVYNTLPQSLKELCDMHEAIPVENRFPKFADLMLEFKENGVSYNSYEYRTVKREIGAINSVIANQKEALKRAGVGTEALEMFKAHAQTEKSVIISTTKRINELNP